MSYIPTQWKTWDVVTADKLNKIENAIGNMIIEWDGESNLTVSYDDIANEISAGKMVYLVVPMTIDVGGGSVFVPISRLAWYDGNPYIYAAIFYVYSQSGSDGPYQFGEGDPSAPLIYNYNHESEPEPA